MITLKRSIIFALFGFALTSTLVAETAIRHGSGTDGDPNAIGFNRDGGNGYIYNNNVGAWQITARDSNLSIEGYNGVNPSLFTLLKNGDLGVGTNTPKAKLDIRGNTVLIANHR